MSNWPIWHASDITDAAYKLYKVKHCLARCAKAGTAAEYLADIQCQIDMWEEVLAVMRSHAPELTLSEAQDIAKTLCDESARSAGEAS